MIDSPLADTFRSSGRFGAHESVMGFDPSDPLASITTNAAKAVEFAGLTEYGFSGACRPPWGTDLMPSFVGNLAGYIDSESQRSSSETAQSPLTTSPTARADFPTAFVEDFVKAWRLDSRCHAMISKVCKTVSPEKVMIILQDFDMSPESKEANAKFMVWFGSQLRRFEAKAESGALPCGAKAITDHAETASDVAALDQFCNRWSLSKRTRSHVKKLSPPVQQTLLQTFDPPANTRNVDVMLLEVVRSIIAKDEKGPSPQPPDARDVRDQALLDQYVEDFSEQMQLDETLTTVLREFVKKLPEASCVDPRHQRGTPADSRNAPHVQGRKRATLPPRRSIASGTPARGDQPTSDESLNSKQSLDEFCDSFVTSWDLDARCRTVMEELSKEVSEDEFRHVLGKFCITSDTLNASAKFMVFIQLQTKRYAAARQVPVPEEELTAFLNHWAFDARTQQELRTVPPLILRRVMSGFRPPADTKSVDAKLFAFLRVVRQRAPRATTHSKIGVCQRADCAVRKR